MSESWMDGSWQDVCCDNQYLCVCEDAEADLNPMFVKIDLADDAFEFANESISYQASDAIWTDSSEYGCWYFDDYWHDDYWYDDDYWSDDCDNWDCDWWPLIFFMWLAFTIVGNVFGFIGICQVSQVGQQQSVTCCQGLGPTCIATINSISAAVLFTLAMMSFSWGDEIGATIDLLCMLVPFISAILVCSKRAGIHDGQQRANRIVTAAPGQAMMMQTPGGGIQMMAPPPGMMMMAPQPGMGVMMAPQPGMGGATMMMAAPGLMQPHQLAGMPMAQPVMAMGTPVMAQPGGGAAAGGQGTYAQGTVLGTVVANQKML